MVKIIFLTLVMQIGLFAADTNVKQGVVLEKCLACHKQEQIPNTLIYRRYLVKYSTQDAMLEAIVKYLKNPQKELSVMPPPFFLKFTMKPTLDMNDKELEEGTRAFLEKIDIKKKLVLPK